MSYPLGEPAELAALVPQLIEFRPDDRHVVIFGFGDREDDQFVTFDIAPTNTEESQHFSEQAANTLQIIGRYDCHPNMITIASYGEHGKARAHAVEDGLRTQLDAGQNPSIIQLHIDLAAQTVETYLPNLDEWTLPEPIKSERVDAIGALLGSSPAASLDDAKNAYEHTGISVWQPLPAAEIDAINDQKHVDRGTEALSILDRLATPGEHPRDTDYPRLAALMDSSTLIRDLVITHDTASRPQAEVLRQAFLACPPEYVGLLGAVGGIKHYTAGDVIGGKQLALQVPPNNPDASIAGMVSTATEAGFPPHKLQDLLNNVNAGLGTTLREADLLAERNKTKQANFPETGRTTNQTGTQQPGTTSQQSSKEKDAGNEK